MATALVQPYWECQLATTCAPASLVPLAHLCLAAPRLPCRRLDELEARLVEEETALRVQQLVEAKVGEVLGSDVVQQTLQQRLEDERRKMEEQARAQAAHGVGVAWEG